ncbi:phage integrase family protein [Streptomyces sp. Amel2xB2]|uniref:tyrosine-type recombinase/integrase n=1 Tax=Streptomyces sp. Amel2xB2 TaxID=1305829 RepID=UPI000DC02A6F|nr:tyrosine-type recombinase/integrase [Streptomyces sp. Amel2xB2]RAJ61709.1 phage integrase family protein [Streptomyces sp. Amel2xB2]
MKDAERAEWGEAHVDSGRMFTCEDGTAIHPGWLSDHFERLIEESGLPAIRLHDLRHVAASLMLAADVDIKIVSETLGHSDTRITRDTYQSVMPEVAAEAAEATAAIVPRGTARQPKPTEKEQAALDEIATLATDKLVADIAEAAVEHDGHTTATHEGAKIIEFRPRKVRA